MGLGPAYGGASEVESAPVDDELSEEVTFTATSSFLYVHSRGVRPSVTVTGSDGVTLGVCTTHVDTNIVSIGFNGTITNGNLILG